MSRELEYSIEYIARSSDEDEPNLFQNLVAEMGRQRESFQNQISELRGLYLSEKNRRERLENNLRRVRSAENNLQLQLQLLKKDLSVTMDLAVTSTQTFEKLRAEQENQQAQLQSLQDDFISTNACNFTKLDSKIDTRAGEIQEELEKIKREKEDLAEKVQLLVERDPEAPEKDLKKDSLSEKSSLCEMTAEESGKLNDKIESIEKSSKSETEEIKQKMTDTVTKDDRINSRIKDNQKVLPQTIRSTNHFQMNTSRPNSQGLPAQPGQVNPAAQHPMPQGGRQEVSHVPHPHAPAGPIPFQPTGMSHSQGQRLPNLNPHVNPQRSQQLYQQNIMQQHRKLQQHSQHQQQPQGMVHRMPNPRNHFQPNHYYQPPVSQGVGGIRPMHQARVSEAPNAYAAAPTFQPGHRYPQPGHPGQPGYPANIQGKFGQQLFAAQQYGMAQHYQQPQYPSKKTSKAILIKDQNTGKAVNMNDEKPKTENKKPAQTEEDSEDESFSSVDSV